jgi:lipopolysaccharide/colanic/teichoic acid biosynthesis glycosyltransferase
MEQKFTPSCVNQYYASEPGNPWTTRSPGKRLFDIVLSALMIVLFAPLMLVIALWLKAADRGPALYAQARIGKGGRVFRCLKFRTMVQDAEARLEALLETDPALRAEWDSSRKLREDPRIIPGIGHLLRRASLDELPQLFNVLRGDMSIVGPRPVVREELQYYGLMQKHYLSVRPGLTGPWQADQRSDSSYDRRVQQDTDYVRTGSLSQDIRIVFTTAQKFLRRDLNGAY